MGDFAWCSQAKDGVFGGLAQQMQSIIRANGPPLGVRGAKYSGQTLTIDFGDGGELRCDAAMLPCVHPALHVAFARYVLMKAVVVMEAECAREAVDVANGHIHRKLQALNAWVTPTAGPRPTIIAPRPPVTWMRLTDSNASARGPSARKPRAQISNAPQDSAPPSALSLQSRLPSCQSARDQRVEVIGRLNVPGDGHCYFYAIIRCFQVNYPCDLHRLLPGLADEMYTRYDTGTLYETLMPRLRQLLAGLLDENDVRKDVFAKLNIEGQSFEKETVGDAYLQCLSAQIQANKPGLLGPEPVSSMSDFTEKFAKLDQKSRHDVVGQLDPDVLATCLKGDIERVKSCRWAGGVENVLATVYLERLGYTLEHLTGVPNPDPMWAEFPEGHAHYRRPYPHGNVIAVIHNQSHYYAATYRALGDDEVKRFT